LGIQKMTHSKQITYFRIKNYLAGQNSERHIKLRKQEKWVFIQKVS